MASRQVHQGLPQNDTVHDVDIDLHLSALDHCQHGRATLPVNQVNLVAVDHDPAAGRCTWPAPLTTQSLGPRP